MDHKLDKNAWSQRFSEETRGKNESEMAWQSPEGIPYRPLYGPDDLAACGYQPEFPGFPPYTRGVRASLYVGRPWTIRQYAGFSTAEASNRFYRDCLAAGQTGLSVAFDLPTHRGYDSDHPDVQADVGKAGVAIDSVEDMKTLFAHIPLERVSVSMTMNGAVLPILAAYLVAGEESGVPHKQLAGTIQNDILKEYMVRNTYIYPPAPSMRIVSDIIAYTAKEMPRFNSISISGYHMQEAGANAVLELAYTIADGLEYVRAALKRGLDVDAFASQLSFFFGIGMNFYMEIAKLRAARRLWFEVMQPFQPKDPKSSWLRTHCQTSGYTLTAQDPYNNIVRTTVEAMAAVLGGTQSLHTNSFDEALSLPTDLAARVARNTQLILEKETDLTHTVDPFGGSYFMETLTSDLCEKARLLLQEVEACGGMTAAIQKGIPKQRIEEAAASKQGRIDSRQDIIVGVNQYQSPDATEIPVRTIDNTEVARAQLERLAHLKAHRDPQAVEKTLAALTQAAQDPHANLLPPTIEAMRARATVGEVSLALERVFTRYQSPITLASSTYMKAYDHPEALDQIRAKVAAFAKQEGRQPRILLVKLGQDGHDRGVKVVASGLSDLGFDVDMGPLFQTPEQAVQQAIENDVHVLGISTQAAGHQMLVPQVLAALKKANAPDIRVVVGGVIPPQDYAGLLAQGVAAIFGPGSDIPSCAEKILAAIPPRRRP